MNNTNKILNLNELCHIHIFFENLMIKLIDK